MGADITLRASLWLTIFVVRGALRAGVAELISVQCMLIRYTGVDTTWDRSLHIDGVSNSTAEIVTSIHVSNMLGLFVLCVHIVMVFPLLVRTASRTLGHTTLMVCRCTSGINMLSSWELQ
jgi:hypothetical protein